MFINAEYIENLLENTDNVSSLCIEDILDKASRMEGLTHEEVAVLLKTESKEHVSKIFKVALEIKERIYGNRIVMFAPLYVSDYCDNRCTYCSFNHSHKFERRKLTMDEIREEVKVLEQMGHKRIALEAGESEEHCSIDYVLECIKTIYDARAEYEKNPHADNQAIRRINVNIASTTVENYRKLKEANIGTYILFQETYHKETYEKVHISGAKKDYEYHLTAFDRAMQGGIDDVGAGVLFGLADPYFEVLGLMIHNEHLEKEYGVGFHTVSVPRLREALGTNIKAFPNLLTDDVFKKIVAIIRLAMPFTGLILSTRENYAMRQDLLKIGVSQLSAGSNTNVGGYSKVKEGNPQFIVSDERSAPSIISDLIDNGYIASFCTACYREGRTGDRFMRLVKSGEIKNVCLPNALMTLYEYTLDYGNSELQEKVKQVVLEQVSGIEKDSIRSLILANVEKLQAGERDLFL